MRVVVHSSWRLVHTFDRLRQVLALLEPWLAGVSPIEYEAREASILEDMRRRRLSAEEIVILDDQPALFTVLRTRVIACEPEIGLTSATLGQLTEVLRGAQDAFLARGRASLKRARWNGEFHSLEATLDEMEEHMRERLAEHRRSNSGQ